MLSKRRIWNCNFVLILLVLQTAVMYIEPYDFKCPSQSSWRLWAQVKCKRTMKYFCLYNNVEGKYVEGCEGPDWDRKGNKRIYAGDFSRAKCAHTRFQPFLFWSNGSMTDCVYEKSLCSEAGQIVHRENSTKDDRSCRCDFKQKYEFIKTPNNACFCIPTEEDCSCYYKANSTYSPVSAGIGCTKSGINENQNRTDVILCDKSLVGTTEKERMPLKPATSNFNMFKWEYKTDTTLIVCLCFVTIFVAGGFSITVFFNEWTSDKIQSFEKYFRRNKTAGGQRLKQEGHHQIENSKLKTDDINFLRLTHLLIRVACPVVRMFFNNEIKPDQLRKTLDKKKQEIIKQYRKKDKIINDYQWNLIFGPDMGRKVTSDDFDIRLMVYLLSTLANIEVGDSYPVYSDTRTGAMLSRIKFISNKTLRNFEGKLAGFTFDRSWDDISQAVLKLGSSLKLDIQNEQEKTRMIDRLLVLSPITIDNKTLRIFIYLSEIYPAMILQQLISEYCTLNSLTINYLLRREKHQLYHKRIKTESCCICPKHVSTFYKVIPEKQWKAYYETNKDNYSHSCPFDLKQCSERFVPKQIDACSWNISMSKALILNVPDILTYMAKRLCISGFDQFLMNNQHVLCHAMGEKRCCKCYEGPAEKKIINKEEWNILFKKVDNISCHRGYNNCCCQYFVRNGLKITDIDPFLLSNIFAIAGPIGVLNNIEHDALLYFLNWTVDGEPLRRVLTNLQNMLQDKRFKASKSFFETPAEQSDARRWIAKNLRKQEATTEPQLQILINDDDGLSVKSVLIPKYFTLPVKSRKFGDLTTEENNYLVVVHGLTKIVYPIIQNEFNTQCPDHVLDEIRFSIYDKQVAKIRQKDGKKGRTKEIHLTEDHQRQLFSQTREESKNLDLELMIYILKKRSNYEWNKVYIDQLDVIENIRRQIVQSTSGTLHQTKFHDIVNSISKVVLHFGGESFKKELSRLQHIRNILD